MRRQGPRRKERTNVNNNRTFPDIIIDVVATTFGPAFALMPMPPAAGESAEGCWGLRPTTPTPICARSAPDNCAAMERFQEDDEGRRGRGDGEKGHGMVEMCGGSGEGMQRRGRFRDMVS